MLLIKRRPKSQRSSVALKLELHNHNTAGQGGDAVIVLFDPLNEIYYNLELESVDEANNLLSATAKASHHVKA